MKYSRVNQKTKRPLFALTDNGRLVLATSYSRTTYRCTTIGAAAFHFRVRNGNGWGHCAMITRGLTPWSISDCGSLIDPPSKPRGRQNLWPLPSIFKELISNHQSKIR